ncbi:hypothetical protein K438DRAFT_1847969 [Mycena galopus ATCC 62051]|nr:hypothetical protein K438DRAFT_1847969 [Mycena galopus ATCC 62051]
MGSHTRLFATPPWRHHSHGSAPAPAYPSFRSHVTRACALSPARHCRHFRQAETATCTLKYSGSLPCWGKHPSATCCHLTLARTASPARHWLHPDELVPPDALLSAPHDSAMVGEALQRLRISVQPHRRQCNCPWPRPCAPALCCYP